MDLPTSTETPTLEETIESLARTVAHLALQLTVAQIQLRALGTELAESNQVSRADVLSRTAKLAEESAGKFLIENLGPDLAGLIDVVDLERQIVDFLSREH